MEGSELFSVLLAKVREINSLITDKCFINSNGKTIYNPANKKVLEERMGKSLKKLLDEKILSQNPALLIFTDNNIKSQQAVKVTIQ